MRNRGNTSTFTCKKIARRLPTQCVALTLFALLFAGIVGPAGAPLAAQDLTGEEVIRRLEDNQTQSTAIMEGRMIITDRFGERESTYIAHTEGEDRFLVEFTSRDERGQRILRRDDNLYLYYPDAREVIRLQGSALRDSLLGSDVSYEDMTGGRGLLEDYDAELIGQVEVDGRTTYEVHLEARTTDVAYPEQVYYVDTEDFVLRKAEQYARSGRLLKELEVLETAVVDDYHFPTHMRITDQTRGSSGTEMIIEDYQVDVSLPSDIFSLEELSW